MNFVMIEKPRGIRVHVIPAHEVLGKGQTQRRRRVFPGVKGTEQEKRGLGAGVRRIPQAQNPDIVAPQSCGLLPGISDIHETRQARCIGRHRLRRQKILLHRPIAGKAREALDHRRVTRRGDYFQAGGQQEVDLLLASVHDVIALNVIRANDRALE